MLSPDHDASANDSTLGARTNSSEARSAATLEGTQATSATSASAAYPRVVSGAFPRGSAEAEAYDEDIQRFKSDYTHIDPAERNTGTYPHLRASITSSMALFSKKG